MGLFAVIGPSRNEYRSGDASLRCRYFSTIPSRCHQASSSRSSAGKSGRLSTASNAVPDYGHEPFLPRTITLCCGPQRYDKTPVLNSEDGRTRGTTSVAHRCRGPLPSQIDGCLTQLVFRVIGRTRALLGGHWPFRRRLRGDILEGPGDPASIVPGLLFADWLGRGPRHCLRRE